jgi:hypothetical protein
MSEDEQEQAEEVTHGVDHVDLDASNKRKLLVDDENDNSFEIMYVTPYAKVAYNSSKRVRIDILSSTEPVITPPPPVSPAPLRKPLVLFKEVIALESSPIEISHVTLVEESPDRQNSPAPLRKPLVLFKEVRALESSPIEISHVTLVKESLDRQNISRDMFCDSFDDMRFSMSK